MTIDEFLVKFPEFEGRIEDDVLTELIAQIKIETCNYDGINNDDAKLQALALRVAYEIEKSQPLNVFINGNVKRIESLNDVIEYGVSNISPDDFNANKYGVRLKRLLTLYYSGGFKV